MPAAPGKKHLRPVIRVFVSSTFSDLKLERDALQRRAFPELEQFCLRQGFQFQAIDLRWGVPTEAGLEHRTMRICFDELRRSQTTSPQPNFLILLGDRYGWQPLPEEISIDEFHQLEVAAANAPPTGAGQPAVAVLEQWYRRDDNAVPAVYVLQSRRQKLEDGHDYTDEAVWRGVQAVLWQIVNRAYPPEQLAGRFVALPAAVDQATATESATLTTLPSIVRFQASATEQEIWCGALTVPDARDHVFAFFRTIRDLSQLASDPRVAQFVDRDDHGEQDPKRHAALGLLKAELRSRLGEQNVLTINNARLQDAADQHGEPIVAVSDDHLLALCDFVRQNLTAIIQRQIDEYWHATTTEQPAAQKATEPVATEARIVRVLEIEQDEHRRFGEERAPRDSFVGRERETARILNYLGNDDSRPLIVYGPSGSGKTALLAHAAHLAEQRGVKPLVRFLGVTSRSSDLRSLLTGICQELRQTPPVEKELPTDVRELVQELYYQLGTATSQRAVHLFLDALDQLDDADHARSLWWIRSKPLPPHAKLIVSCLSDAAQNDPAMHPYAALAQRRLLENAVPLDSLSPAEAQALFDRWVATVKPERQVSAAQRQAILARILLPEATACRQPLYLRILYEESRLWRSYDPVTPLGRDVVELLGSLFDRLSLPVWHGPLVEHALSYLASARFGLTENELLEVLFADPDYRSVLDTAAEQSRNALPLGAKRIPISLWSRLRYDLAPYLAEHGAPGGTVLEFYHRQVGRYVRERFLDELRHRALRHQRLGDYFDGLDYYGESLEQQPARAKRLPATAHSGNLRKVMETPFHRIEAARFGGESHPNSPCWNAVAELLSSFAFVAAKIEAGLVFDLKRDYAAAFAAWPGDEGTYQQRRREELRDWLARGCRPPHPATGWSDERPWGKKDEQEGPRPSEPSTYAAMCEWQSFVSAKSHVFAECPRLVFQEAYNWAASGAVAEGAAVQTMHPHLPWLRLLNRRARPFGKTYPGTLLGHTSLVEAVAISADGQLVVSAGRDQTVRGWDLLTGDTKVLRGHAGWINALAMTPDGQFAISGGDDQTLRVWNLHSEQCLRTLEGHSVPIHAVAVTPDGQSVVYGGFRPFGRVELGMWDLKTLEHRLWPGHREAVKAVAITSDGRHAVSASEDGTIKLWDVDSGTCLRTLQGHGNWVNGVAITPDGSRVLSGGHDNMLRLWDLSAGSSQVLKGHRSYVSSVAISPDGRLAVSGGGDCTVRVWYLRTGETRTIGVHTQAVAAVAITADGRQAVSGGNDHTVLVWDLDRPPGDLERHVAGAVAAASGDGRRAIASSGHQTWLWDLQSLQGRVLPDQAHQDVSSLPDADESGRVHALGAHQFHWPRTVAMTRDGGTAVIGRGDGTLCIWKLQTNESFERNGHQGSSASGMRGISDVDAVLTLAITPDGRRVVSGGKDGTIRVWDLETGSCLQVMKLPQAREVRSVAVTADGRRAMSVGADGNVRVWNLKTGSCERICGSHTSRSGSTAGGIVNAVVLTPDDRLAISGGVDKKLRVWNLHGAESRVFVGHTHDVTVLAATPDGRRVVSGSIDKTVRVWNLASGKHSILRGHANCVYKLAVSPDGRFLVSGGMEQTVRLWSLDTEEELTRFECEDQVSSCLFAGPGLRLVVGDFTGRLYVVDLENCETKPPIETAWCAPDGSLAMRCPFCSGYPFRRLPDRAVLGCHWQCSTCGNIVRLNPFTIDTAW
ncbi:MAG: AAA family ATPase [Rhodopirellula sp.]|nr:AAA family ATPase [Rhodopirellula sp.]